MNFKGYLLYILLYLVKRGMDRPYSNNMFLYYILRYITTSRRVQLIRVFLLYSLLNNGTGSIAINQ